MGGYRTLNPWGHVSKGDRMARQAIAGNLSAKGRIYAVENGKALLEELRQLLQAADDKGKDELPPDQKMRVNAICRELNAKGIPDRVIELAL